MRDVQDFTGDYEALRKKYQQLQVDEEELASNYRQLQIAKEDLRLQVEDLNLKKGKLQQSEELLKESQRVACIGHYIFSIPNSTWEGSEMLLEILGIDYNYPHDIESWVRIVHPSHQQELFEYLTNHVLANKQPFNKEYKIIRVSDKQERWVLGLGNFKFDTEGNPLELFGITQDITERKQIEAALEERNQRLKHQRAELIAAKEKAEEREETYRMLFESINDAVFISEMAGDISTRKFIKVNDVACQWLGYSMPELLALPPSEIYSESSKKLIPILFQEVIRKGHSIYELEHITKQGHIVPVEISFSVTHFKDKTWFHAIARDISERKLSELHLKEKADEIEAQNEEYRQINEELYIAKEKAEESDRLKTAFLQNMSHEIRTPMNAIVGFSELLSENQENSIKVEKYSKIIKQRSNDLLSLINDLLDIAKIESGQLSMDIQPCNIETLFEELSSFFVEYLAKQCKQHISLNIHLATANVFALADNGKLKQVFINLIGNAIKFTSEGTIEVSYFLDYSEHVTFYVKDSGIGIPIDKQKFIFDRFVQVDNGPQQIYGGTGLGLSIVKGLLNLMGGKIWLESAPGVGSTFFFTIPIDTSEKS